MNEQDIRDIIGPMEEHLDFNHPNFDPELTYFLMWVVRPLWFTDAQREEIKRIRDYKQSFKRPLDF